MVCSLYFGAVSFAEAGSDSWSLYNNTHSGGMQNVGLWFFFQETNEATFSVVEN